MPPCSQLEAAINERYRETVDSGRIEWNPTLGHMLGHRSTRAFSTAELKPGTIEVLAAAAQSAPTSSNTQSYSIVAVQDPSRKARLASLADNQGFIATAPLLLLWVADLARARAVGAEGGEDLEALDYLETWLVASIDAMLAAQNAVVAAASLGLGSVYLGSMRNAPEAVAAEIGLPRGSYVVAGLSVGYPDPDRPTSVKPRLPQPVVLHREQWTDAGQPALIARHDDHMRAFRRSQGLPDAGWSQMLRDRFRNVAALRGRDQLVSILRRMGFALR
ncbi:MAG: NADPH-dependent oxidoreductase [Salinarimonadaceae bacterium]|nr:MAG: NADPH-dependent oxidoreductase [Salinarimonadaceae bacterium]